MKVVVKLGTPTARTPTTIKYPIILIQPQPFSKKKSIPIKKETCTNTIVFPDLVKYNYPSVPSFKRRELGKIIFHSIEKYYSTAINKF
ncbi:hypothetical protein BGP_6366 [Beggiatoa sp. PS]|nr:hypothetical protein BGP_6366 [Beggiatoa sp. PS]